MPMLKSARTGDVPIQATTAYFYFFQIIYRANLAEQVFH
jgi:hypothetical protein